MKNAILLSDEDITQLRDGGSLELDLGEQTVTVLYVRRTGMTPTMIAKRDASLAKARRVLARIWRSPEGHKKMIRATREGKKRAALARAQKNGKNGGGNA